MSDTLKPGIPLPPPRFIRRKKRTRQLLRILIYTGLVLLLVWPVASRTWRAINLRLLATERVFTGVLSEKLKLEGLVFRGEVVLVAPATGRLQRIAREGDKVPAGALLAKIFPAATSWQDDKVYVFKAPFAGQVCYHPDGLESIFKPDLVDKISLAEIKRLARMAQPATLKDTVSSGEAVLRLTNNLLPAYFLTELEALPEGWQAGKALRVNCLGREEKLRAELCHLQKLEYGWLALFKLQPWGDELFHARRLTIEAEIKTFRGVIVPREALEHTPDGKTSVYLLKGTKLSREEVEVVGLTGEQAAVKGLGEGTEIITNPQIARRLILEP